MIEVVKPKKKKVKTIKKKGTDTDHIVQKLLNLEVPSTEPGQYQQLDEDAPTIPIMLQSAVEALEIEELPEEVKVTEVITKTGQSKQQITKKKTIKKRVGQKEEHIEVVTVQQDDMAPETTITVTEEEAPDSKPVDDKPKPKKKKVKTIKTTDDSDDIIERLLNLEVHKTELEQYEKIDVDLQKRMRPVEETTIEEHPEVVEEVRSDSGVIKKKVVKKKIIKKRVGPKEEVTEEVTIQEDGKQPETTVTISEHEVPYEVTEPFEEELKPLEAVVDEYPEPMEATLKTKSTKIVKKKVKKLKQGEAVSEEAPQEEVDDLILAQAPLEQPTIEELPEHVEVVEIITKEGKPKKQVTKTKIIKKKTTGKVEEVKIVTVQEDNQEPETTVTLTEEDTAPETVTATSDEIPMIEVVKPKKKKVKIIKKKGTDTDHIVQKLLNLEVTSTEPEQYQQLDEDAPTIPIMLQSAVEALEIEELPEEVKVTEVITRTGQSKQQITKKKTIKKRVGQKEEHIEVVTVQQDDMAPETTITVTEEEAPDSKPVDDKPKPKKKKVKTIKTTDDSDDIIERLLNLELHKTELEQYEKIDVDLQKRMRPVEETTIEEHPEVVEEVRSDSGVIKKKVVKKKIIKKRVGPKEEVTEEVTIQEDDKQPETTVTISEHEVPYEVTEPFEEELKPLEAVVDEYPEPMEATLKTKSTKIVKKKVKKLKQGEAVSEEAPQEEVDDLILAQAPLEQPTIEELPEHVEVVEIITKEGKPKKQVTKTKIIKKKTTGKVEEVKIVTVQEDNQVPETTVTMTEEDTAPETVTATSDEIPMIEDVKPKKKKVKTIKKKGNDTNDIVQELLRLVELESETETYLQPFIEEIEEPLSATSEHPKEIKPTQKGKPKKQTHTTTSQLDTQDTHSQSCILPQTQDADTHEHTSPEYITTFETCTDNSQTFIKSRNIKIIKEHGAVIEETFDDGDTRTISHMPSEVLIEEIEESAPSLHTTQLEETPQIVQEVATKHKPKKKQTQTQADEQFDSVTIEQAQLIPEETEHTAEICTVVSKKAKSKKSKVTVIQGVTESVVAEDDDELPLSAQLIPVHEQAIILSELPEQVSVQEVITMTGEARKQITKKKTIKKRVGQKEEHIEVVTVQQDDMAPETTITVTEEEAPDSKPVDDKPKPKKKKVKTIKTTDDSDDIIERLLNLEVHKTELEQYEKIDVDLQKRMRPVEETTIEEHPEVVEEVRSDSGVIKKKVVKKKIIKKRVGPKEEVTEEVTIQEDGKQPETTVTISEHDVPYEVTEPFEEELKPLEAVVDEYPEPMEATLKTKSTKIVKKKVKKLKQGEAVSEEAPQEEVDDLILAQAPLEQPTIEELPEHVEVVEIITKEGKPKKQVTKTKIIKKKTTGKVEEVKIVTVQEDNQVPETTVTMTEEDTAPETVTATSDEIPMIEDVKPKKKKVKIIKKKGDDTDDIIQKLLNLEVKKTELERYEKVDVEIKSSTKQTQEVIVEDLPQLAEISDVPVQSIVKKITKTKSVKSKKPQEDIQTVSVAAIDEHPEPHVSEQAEPINQPEETFEQAEELPYEMPLEQFPIVEELPEEIMVNEVVTLSGEVKKQTTKKRTVKKTTGDKQELVEVVTVEEEGHQPETTITIIESEVRPESPITIEQIDTEPSVKQKEPRKLKKKKVKTIKTTDEVDDIIERLLNLEVKKTELERYERVEVELKKRHKSLIEETLERPEAAIAILEMIESPKLETVRKSSITQPKETEELKKKVKKKKPTSTVQSAEDLVPLTIEPMEATVVPEEITFMEGTLNQQQTSPIETITKKKISKKSPRKEEPLPTTHLSTEESSLAPSVPQSVEMYNDELTETDIVREISVVEPQPQEACLEQFDQSFLTYEEKSLKKLQEQQTKPVPETQIELKKTEKKAKKKPKKEQHPEEDEQLQRLLNLEVEKTQLEQYEKIELEDKPKPEKPKPVLVPQKIERKEQKAQKMQISEPEEQPQMVRLRKVKVPDRKEIEEVVVPKVLLKSRIVDVQYPPEAMKPVITDLTPVKAIGLMSRIEEEESPDKLKKVKKIRTSKSKRLELETPETMDYEDEKPEKEEFDQEAHKYQRKPKETTDDKTEEKTLKLGKGKLPKEDAELEQVKLKKTPKKPKEDEPEDQKSVSKPKQKPTELESDDKQRHVEKPEYKPIDIPDYSTEMEEYKAPEPTPDEPEEETKKKLKPKRRPKTPDDKEDELKPLVMGKGKPKPDAPEDDVKFRIPAGKKEDEEPTDIKLKPFTKPTSKEEQPVKEADREMALPATTDKPEEPDVDLTSQQKVKKIIKKTKPKQKSDSQERTEEPVEETMPQPVSDVAEDVPDIVHAVVPKTITDDEFQKPEELDLTPQPQVDFVIEQLPEEVKVTQVITSTGAVEQQTVKKRIIKKKKDDKEELIEIVTVQKGDDIPEATVTVTQVTPEDSTTQPESAKRKVRIKKIIKPDTLDADIERLLNQEISKTELEVYEKTDFEPTKRVKEQPVEEPVLQTAESEISSPVVPQKTKVKTKAKKQHQVTPLQAIPTESLAPLEPAIGHEATEQTLDTTHTEDRRPISADTVDLQEDTFETNEFVETETLGDVVQPIDVPEAVLEKPEVSLKPQVTAAPYEQVLDETVEQTDVVAADLPQHEQAAASEIPSVVTETPIVSKPILEAAPIEEVLEQQVEETGNVPSLELDTVQVAPNDVSEHATEIPTVQGKPLLEAAPMDDQFDVSVEEADTVASLTLNEEHLTPVDVTVGATEVPSVQSKPTIAAAPSESLLEQPVEETSAVQEPQLETEKLVPVEEQRAEPTEEAQLQPAATIETAPAEAPKKVVKKVTKVAKKTKKSIDDDEELQRLLNLEVEKTELEQYEKIDVDGKPKVKPEKGEIVKLEPIKIERKEQKPIKPEITDTQEPQTVKLRKTVVPEKREVEEVAIPKVLLKSRIEHVEFSVQGQQPEIVQLDTRPGVGTLSRTEEDEVERTKKVIKKVKVIKKEKPEVETLDIEKYEKEPKEEVPKDEEKSQYQRQPKEAPKDEPEERTLQMGKGKLKKDEDHHEEVKLKKTPSKPKEETEEEVKPKKQVQEKPKEEDLDTKKRTVEKPKFTPTDIPDYETPLEPYVKVEPQPEESPVQEPEKPKVPKEPKVPETPEEPEHKIVLGKGKKPEPEPEEEFKFRKPVPSKPEDEKEEIKLKPFTKPTPDTEPKEREGDRDMALPVPKDLPDDADTETTKKKVIKKVVKKPKAPVEEQPQPEEPVQVQEAPVPVEVSAPVVEEVVPKPLEEIEKPKEVQVEQPKEMVLPQPAVEQTEVLPVPQVPEEKPIETVQEPAPESKEEIPVEVQEQKEKVVKKKVVKKPKKKPEEDAELERLLNLEIEKTELETYEKIDLEPKPKEAPVLVSQPTVAPIEEKPVVEKPVVAPVVEKAQIVEEVLVPEEVSAIAPVEVNKPTEPVQKQVPEEVVTAVQEPAVTVKTDVPKPIPVEEKAVELPVEPERIEEKKPVVKKKVVKKPKKASIEDDEQLQRLLNMEIEKTELEKYEKIDVDIKKPEKTVETVEEPRKAQVAELEEPEPVEVTLKPKKTVKKPVEPEPVEAEFKITKKPRLPEAPQEVEEQIILKPSPQKSEETVSVERIIKVEVEQPEVVEQPTIEEVEEDEPQPVEDLETVEPVVEEPLETEAPEEEIVPVQPLVEEVHDVQPIITDAVIEAPSEELPTVVESVPIQPIVEEPQPVTPLRKVSLKPVEPQPETVEKKPAEKPKKKVVVVKKKKASIDDDAELQRLLNLEIEKTDLEQYERVDVDLRKREKVKIEDQPQPQQAVESMVEPEDSAQLKLPRKKSKPKVETVEETEVEFKIKPKKQPIAEETVQEATVSLKKPKPPAPVVEETATEEVILLKPAVPQAEEVEDVDESIKVKPKPAPYTTDEAEASLKIVREAEQPTAPEPAQPEPAKVEEKKPEKPKKKVVPKKKKDDDVDEITKKLLEMEVPKTELEKYEKIDLDIVKPAKETIDEVTMVKRKPKAKPSVEEEDEVETKLSLPRKKPSIAEPEEAEATFKVARKPSIPQQTEDVEASITITKEEEVPAEEEITEHVVVRKQRPRPKPAFRREVLDEEEVRIKKIKKVRQPRPVFKDIEPENVTFRPKRTKHIEDIEQEFKIQLDSYAREEISMSGRVKLPAPYSYGEETGEAHITIIKQVDEDDEVVYEVIYDDSEQDMEEEYHYQDEDTENVVIELRRRREKLENLIMHHEEEISFDLTQRNRSQFTTTTHEEESFTLKQPKKVLPTYSEETASLKIVREEDANDMYCIQAVEAENEEALHIVEGEKVYVIEHSNSEWWYVKRSWCEERGFVRREYLMDAVTYPQYVQKTLNEKIDKLPVFEKPGPGEKPLAPKIIEKLQPITTQDGYTVQFECKVEGFPRPSITWFRQTAVIKPSQDFQIYYDDDNVATLIIREVFPEDAGTFTCVAKNNAGFASSATELVVDSFSSDHGSDVATLSRKSMSRESSLADILEGIPPTFSRKPKAQYVDAGSDVLLECRLVAVPEPDILWYYNGVEIESKDNVQVVVESDMHMYCTVVHIKGIDKVQEGSYQVVARNREGESSLDIMVKVKTGVQEPPQILEPLKSMTIRQGETVMLSTQIVGNPAPEVQWFKNGVALDVPTQADRNIYTVTLVAPTHDNAGEYTVRAKNPAGSVETSAFLTVDESNVGNPQAPLFLERFEEQSVPQGGTIKLPARVTGNPVPEILWLRNNNTLLPSKRVKQAYDGESIELQINNADSEQDSGNYKCIASNTIGKASHGARVTVEVDKVTFTKKLKKTITVEESKAVTLECETSHTVSTKWYHNGKELSGMDHRMIVQEGKVHKLNIKNPTINDTGVYRCTVKDQQTESNLTVIEAKPEFLRKLEDVETKEKEHAVLEVEITSETADVTWYKEGRKLVETTGKYEFTKKGKSRVLFVRNTSVHDEGEYTCALADQECSAEVSIIELPPEIISAPRDVTVARGEDAIFELELTKGDALVRWYRNEDELSFNGHVQLTIDGKRQTLKINKTVDADAGEYTCVVGEQRAKARLTVEKPVVDFVRRLPEVTLTTRDNDAVFTVELSESADVVWYRNSKVITASSKYELIVEKCIRKLIVKNTVEDDEDEYTCAVSNAKTASKLKVEIIKVAPTIFEDGPRAFTIRKDEDVTFSVKFNATPKPEAEWRVNKRVIIPSAKFVSTVTEETASLTIKRAAEVDAGEFTLKLTNECGDASASFTLVIKKQPGAPEAPEATLITDDSITLFWKAPSDDGNSPISQYVLEYQEKNQQKWTEITSITETTTTVTKLTKNSEYTFRATAVNEVGKGPASPNSPYYKIVAPIQKEAPTVSEHLKDVHVGLGQTVTLSCIVTGVPVPDVAWFRNGQPLKQDVVSYENGSAKYQIKSTTVDSGAKYTCRATNEVGSVDSNCQVVIEEKPTLTVEKKQIVQKLRVGDEWKVIAEFTGYPAPELIWHREDEQLTSTAEHTIVTVGQSSTIVISSLDRTHTGKYTVEARNSAGSATVELTLKVIDKPSKPEGPIVVRELSPEAVVIEWKPPSDDGGLEISQFTIEKCDDANKNAWIKVADVQRNIKSYCIQKLIDSTQYHFRVIAQNPVGCSEPLESATVKIQQTVEPPSPPRGPIETSGMTSSSFTLMWQPSESNGGSKITEYVVEVKEAKKKVWKVAGTSSASETSLLIENLAMNKAYDFKITAKNKVGSSEPLQTVESIVAGKEITPPSAPRNLRITNVTSKSVKLEWQQPETNGGSDVTGYIIEKRLTTAQQWTKIKTLESNCLSYCVDNMKEKTELLFRIFAENAVGLSAPTVSESVVLKTHATVPSPPTGPLEVRYLGPNINIVEWGIPESDGGAPIEGYNIAIRNAKKTMWMEVGRVAADCQSFNIKDLQESEDYLIRIMARNEVGISDPLESEEPYTVQLGAAPDDVHDETTRDFSEPTGTNTSSWLREHNMTADINSYARHKLLRRSEYFFKLWVNAKNLFK
ncbi:titin-like isoform X6 [Anopheles funestus]|uniref:titin-like isoform X6 n=2 Tax=Anopheles funestus TaxID=62324 RepID=UPI0020C5F2CB|nr:titin-like isoform X6 [Anopheles funestus]